MVLPFSSRSRLGRATALVAVALVGGVFLAPAAFAHHPDVEGVSNCGATVTFTSTAWAAPTAPERTNPTITIAVSTNSGAFVNLPAKAAYKYDSSNGFQFADTFTPTAGWTSVQIRATAAGTWGDGAAPGDTRTSATITPKTGCVAVVAPTAAVAAATCANGGSIVHLVNGGAAPVDFTISGGAQPQVATVAAGASRDVTVAIPADVSRTLTVVATGMVTVTQAVQYHCAVATPTATITVGATSAVVHLTNAGDAPAVFTIVVPGQPNVSPTVAPGAATDVPVALAGTAGAITVRAPGMADVSAPVAAVATPAPAAAPAGAAPAAVAAPAELPRTGSTTVPAAATGAGLLLAGLALVVADRRRTTTTR